MIYFNNPSTDVYFNLALDEYLLKHDFGDEIFYLWQNNNTVVVGKNQNTLEEINLKAVEEDQVNIIRRSSGGGAVYQDKGNLCFSFIVDKNSPLAKNYQTILQPIIEVLQKLGLSAKFAGKNDIEINGKKISGNAQLTYQNRLLHHGTILFDVNLAKLPKYLNVDQSKIISKGIKSIPARVTNIRPLLKTDITIEQFRDFIIQQLVSDKKAQVLDLPAQVIAEVNKLADEKYRTWDWNYGSSPEFTYQHKIRYEGKGTVDVRLNVEQGKITKIKIFGDFLGSQGTEQLEAALITCKYKRADIKNVVEQFDIQAIFGQNFTTDEIIDVVIN